MKIPGKTLPPPLPTEEAVPESEDWNALKQSILKSSGLFSEYPESTLKFLVKSCKEIRLKRGELLFSEGMSDKGMYIIISGQLSIFKMNKLIDTAGPGEYIGEMLLIDSKPRSASVKALEPVVLMEINEATFQKYIQNNLQPYVSLLKTLCNHSRHNMEVISQDFQKSNLLVHDMRNLLYTLFLPEAYLEMCIKNIENPDQKIDEEKTLDQLKICATKLSSIKTDMLTLIDQCLITSKNFQTQYVKKKLPLLPLIQETVAEISWHNDIQGKDLKIDAPEEIPEVHFNHLDIKRVLQNLIINAGQASPEKGSIQVKVQNREEDMQVSVIDSGKGIPEKIKPLLLNERYTSKEDGNGFGLLSCREVIEKHHDGKFWFESEEGKGTAFHFSLPN